MGWTLDKAENVHRLYVAKTTFHPKHSRKVLEKVDDARAKQEAEFQEAAVLAANTDLGTGWLDAAEHGEGCRGKFLAKRSHSTHSQKV